MARFRRTTVVYDLSPEQYDMPNPGIGGDDPEEQLPASTADGVSSGLSEAGEALGAILTRNPIANILKNVYSFFYWLPKENTPYDIPWTLFKNSSVEFIAWYQFPRNLPPYGYLGEGYRDDMFCWGLPGNTLPLGNWDPCGFQLVSPVVVKKYRESEIKHGRLAMLGCLGCMVQEQVHPFHENIGGLAITHMAQLLELPASESCVNPQLPLSALGGLLPEVLFSVPESPAPAAEFGGLAQFPLDYWLVVLFLSLFELQALNSNWGRWERNEYNHQFDTNIGIGNLKDTYTNGDYGFDPLGLCPTDQREKRLMIEKELNHGRLAMIAFVGIFAQEYITGVPILTALKDWSSDGGLTSLLLFPVKMIDALFSIPGFLKSVTQVPDLGFVQPPPPGPGL